MLNVIYSGRFKKDYKKMCQMWIEYEFVKICHSHISNTGSITYKNQDHDLKGKYKGRRECHIAPDWLLIYEVDGNDLYLDRTGTHSDLFDE